MCSATQLEGMGVHGGAATGHVDLPVSLRNRSASACYLEGFADVRIVDGSGSLLAQASGTSGRGTFFSDAAVLHVMMEPGTAALSADVPGQRSTERGQAWMNVEWYDCQNRQAATLFMTLPQGGGSLSVPYAFRGPYSPACDVPGHATYSSLSRGPLTPSALEWPAQRAYITVAVSIAAPASVHRGSTLSFTVTLSNRSSGDYRLSPCPDYVEILGAKDPVATYQLNCSPVGMIAAGRSAAFEMRLDVPSSLAVGSTQLHWALVDGRLATPYAWTPISLR